MHSSCRSPILALVLVAIVVASTLAAPGGGSSRPSSSAFGTGRGLLDDHGEINPLTGERFTDEETARTRSGLELTDVGRLPEGAIDPDRYRVGPGDRFLFLVTGPTEVQAPVVIDPEGRLFLPYVGVVDVRGATLTEARERVVKRSLEVYSNVNLDLVLVGLRQFKAHVTGAVRYPGSYAATAVTRVSELIEMAGGLLQNASLRRVELVTDDRTVLVDLAGFALGGQLERNPTVVDGVVVRVPKRTHTAYLSGAVENPGPYDPLPGERLSSLLRAVGGLLAEVDSNAVLRSSFVSDTESVETTFAYRPGAGEAHDPLLSDGDRFYFRERPDYLRSSEVFVYGAVRFPGRYPIPVEGAGLRRVLARAGGLTERANLAAAHIQRPAERFVASRGVIDPQDDAYDRQTLDEQRADVVVDSALVVVDLRQLLREDDLEADVLLQDGDIIRVPEDRHEVRVVGLVESPGVYPYAPDLSVSDYIALAGGFDKDADRGRTRMGSFMGAPMSQTGGGEDVTSGSVIFVPSKERREFLTWLRETTAIIAQVASLVVLVDRLTE